jgi:hypothetical protein
MATGFIHQTRAANGVWLQKMAEHDDVDLSNGTGPNLP